MELISGLIVIATIAFSNQTFAATDTDTATAAELNAPAEVLSIDLPRDMEEINKVILSSESLDEISSKPVITGHTEELAALASMENTFKAIEHPAMNGESAPVKPEISDHLFAKNVETQAKDSNVALEPSDSALQELVNRLDANAGASTTAF